MSKQKFVNLTKYAADLKAKLSDTVPVKHVERPVQYKEFLQRELAKANVTVENLKAAGFADKK